MFNNLIESSSHIDELKRRGSFFLFTVTSYAVLFVIAGVASIYAYDATMDDPNTDQIVMLSPLDFANPPPPVQQRAASSGGNSNGRNVAVRQVAMASVNRPDLVPRMTSVSPNTNPPVPDRGAYVIGATNSNPGGAIGPGNPNGEGGSEIGRAGTPVVEVGTPPPPVRIDKPTPPVVHKRVLNGEAILLPKPPYPPIARQMRVQGTVVVQVLVDESGKVISAKPVSGNPVLVGAAQRAAFDARFSPTLLNDQRVKVSGVITYNFVLQQ